MPPCSKLSDSNRKPTIVVTLGGEKNSEEILNVLRRIRASHPEGVMYICAFTTSIPPGIDFLHSTILYRNPEGSLYHQLTSAADVVYKFS